jgi:hypothetical protein
MNKPNSRKDGIVTAIGVLVLVIGTATGNAYVMLALAVVALVVLAVFFRKRVGRTALLAMAVSAVTVAAVAAAITKL